MKTIRTGFAVLLVLLCLVFFSWKFVGWLMPLATATPRPPLRPAPFALLVQKVHFVPVSPYEAAEGYDTNVVIVLNHAGPTPIWWGGSNDGLGIGTQVEALYYQAGANRKLVRALSPWTAPLLIAPVWDEQRQRYVVHYLLDLAHVPAHPGQVTLRGHLAVGMMQYNQQPLSPAILISIPVRRPGQTVLVPTVSHDPMLVIEDVEMSKFATSSANKNGGLDTQVTVSYRYHGVVPPAIRYCSTEYPTVTGYPILTDDHNQEIHPHSICWFGLHDLADGSGGKIPRGQQFQIKYGIRTQPEFMKSKTLILTDFASVYNGWPLSCHILLHDIKKSPWTKPGKKLWYSHPRVLLTNNEHPYE